MDELTDEKILSLDKIIVMNNKGIRRIISQIGTRGAGNTNTFAYSSDGETVYLPENLDGRDILPLDPFERYGCLGDEKVGIAAVVDDVVYLIIESYYTGERKVRAVELGKSYGMRTEIAYDTFGVFYLTPKE